MDIRSVLQQLLDAMDSEGRAYLFVEKRYKVKLYPVYRWLWRMEVNDTHRDENLIMTIKNGVKPPRAKRKKVK